MKCTACCSVLIFLMAATLQAHHIRGRVTDPDGQPLEAAAVYHPATGAYVYADAVGYFELDNVDVGDRLAFYSLGYATQKRTISSRHVDKGILVVLQPAAVGLEQVVLVARFNPLNNLARADLAVNPVRSSQEILRRVPGLVIGQHAGGGKAEQIFLRGFDIDHGTDLAIDVEGMPVNMVSHAHGQGYSDLHFIIPETIENIDFGKGPYRAGVGNFNTAGHVSFKLKDRLPENRVSLEAGQFNTRRGLGMVRVADTDHSQAYLAAEVLFTDGVFEASQNFSRVNLMGRYRFDNREDESLTLTASHFQSQWDASGQIPERAVAAGQISRFGAIDSTEGGRTSRTNLWMSHRKQYNPHQSLRTSAFVTGYQFDLFSNFTFFLEDPVNGDQIRQREKRLLFGGQTAWRYSFHGEGTPRKGYLDLGVGFRYDDVDEVSLSRTANRNRLLERLAYGDVDEFNGFAFAEASWNLGRWTLVPGLRLDHLRFEYRDRLPDTYTRAVEPGWFLAPKFNARYQASRQLQLVGKAGLGFHSNDTRVVVARGGEETLPGALGLEVGAIYRPADRLVLSANLWSLFLEQEFVYVGDAAIVEPSGRTRRLGVETAIQAQLTDHLFARADINYTYARSAEAPAATDRIPLAPELTSSGSLALRDLGPFSGGIRYRYVADRPADESNTLVAEGYFVTDANINYTQGPITLGLTVENLFDTRWKETQFATLSRLRGEPDPVEEIHFTPGTPFFIRAHLQVRF